LRHRLGGYGVLRGILRRGHHRRTAEHRGGAPRRASAGSRSSGYHGQPADRGRTDDERERVLAHGRDLQTGAATGRNDPDGRGLA
jgi:hypothetical protein